MLAVVHRQDPGGDEHVLLALLSEYGVDPERCRLEESDGDEDPSIGPPPDWFRRRE